MALRPGDSPWFFDMSRLMKLAIEHNATPGHILGISLPFTPAPYGLKGTHGIRYGPTCVWLDQVFLSFTNNLLTMTVIRTVLAALLTSVGLLWLTRLLRVRPWLAVIVMVSPWMWYYCRELWDNSLAIPLTALMFAGYGQFLANRRAFPLCLAIVCATLTCLTHLMFVPFLAVLTLHLLIFEYRAVMKNIVPAALTFLVMVLVSLPYLRYAVTFHNTSGVSYMSRYGGWIFPLFDAQHITARGVGFYDVEDWHIIPAVLRYPFFAARIFTYVAFIACWAGMIMAVPRARAALSRASQASYLDHLCLIGLATFAFQTIFDGIEHVSYFPHYYNTTYIVYVMFAWMAFDALPRWFGEKSPVALWLVPVYTACLVFCLGIITWQLARNGGSKGDQYDAALSNQVAVATELNRFSPQSPIDMRVSYWNDRPDTLPVLRQLAPKPAGDLATRRLVVRFRDAFPGDARIVVENYPLATAVSQP
jgi:hypothetical protein